jgi:hypothetical protein
MIETFTPLGVGSEYSWMRSGWSAGHFFVMGKEDRAVKANPSGREPGKLADRLCRSGRAMLARSKAR